mmetsp:Transcript_24767/g.83235  ORF Transcript_24767/g.83235 Transcript_24767/m.83235 type:complete len:200 (-) Transcript_24767:2322-2921(-)
MEFMATARASCVSCEMLPSDMAPVAKRFTMEATGSTSSSLRPFFAPAATALGFQRSRPRRVHAAFDSSTCFWYAWNASRELLRAASCSATIDCGVFRCASPPSRKWNWPGLGSLGAVDVRSGDDELSLPHAASWRVTTSACRASNPAPPMRDGVPARHMSTTEAWRPTASKIWAPLYDCSVEMPILDMTFNRPLASALR